ncbi:hypothetical protein LOZ51_003811 [Ophidiomyces ophidiicola]|nr:hypothetical protein LOZ55_004075 [Ophidiomyces ophidiicola]KAI1983960.1 hypothetical protein LOZ54_004723 [Ophidiomyces ophidiicola]KAI1994615.1 hypothetical protein LOZ51_003811 [Ophidiomyces ophidiicola]
MRLRERGALRPPVRFADDIITIPRSVTRSVSSPGTSPSPSVYSRNVFPMKTECGINNSASFPTLDHPLPESETRSKGERSLSEKRKRGQAAGIQLPRGGCRPPLPTPPDMTPMQTQCQPRDELGNKMMDFDGDGIEPEEENVLDMYEFETSDEEEDNNIVEEGDGNNIVDYGINPDHFRIVEWRDLGPILQTTIIENLSDRYHWAQIMTLLKLSPQDERDAFEHITARVEQVERENTYLKEMRDKQHRALLQIDNSSLKQSRVPAQLIFQNNSERYLRKLTTGSRPDYWMSTAKDVVAARCYLRRIGLDPSLAGQWSSGFAEIQAPSGNNQSAVEDLVWVFNPNHPDGIQQDTVSAIGAQSPPRSSLQRPNSVSQPPHPVNASELTPNIRPIESVGIPKDTDFKETSPPKETAETKPYRLCSSGKDTANDILYKNETPYNTPFSPRSYAASEANSEDTIFRVSIGPEGAARVDSFFEIPVELQLFPSSPPLPSVSSVSTPQRQSFDPIPSDSFSEASAVLNLKENVKPTSTPTKGKQKHKKPLERALSGSWWYDLLASSSVPLTAESSARKNLQDILLPVRAESEIRHLSRPNTHNQASTKPQAMQLPIRTSPLKQAGNTSFYNISDIPTTPREVGSDQLSAMLDSPDTNGEYSEEEQGQASNTLILEGKNESKKDPPDSPVSLPQAPIELLNSRQDHAASNDDIIMTDELVQMLLEASAVVTEEENISAERKSEVLISETEVNTTSSVLQNAEFKREATATQPVFQPSQMYFNGTAQNTEIGGRGDDTPDFDNPNYEKLPASDSEQPGVQSEPTLPESLKICKTRKRQGKRSTTETQKRKSSRLNPPGTRALRPPRSNVQYKF